MENLPLQDFITRLIADANWFEQRGRSAAVLRIQDLARAASLRAVAAQLQRQGEQPQP